MEREDMGSGQALIRLIQAFRGAKPEVGRVKKGTVNETKRICEVVPVSGAPKISRVFLNVVDKAELIVVPADDSYVLYVHARDFRDQAYIVACSKIRKIILKTSPAGTVTFDISDAGVEVKAGANGRVKISPAGTEIGNGEQKQVRGDELQTLLQQILTLLQTMVAWAGTGTPPGGGGTGGIAPLVGATVPTIPTTMLSSKNKVE